MISPFWSYFRRCDCVVADFRTAVYLFECQFWYMGIPKLMKIDRCLETPNLLKNNRYGVGWGTSWIGYDFTIHNKDVSFTAYVILKDIRIQYFMWCRKYKDRKTYRDRLSGKVVGEFQLSVHVTCKYSNRK